VLPPETVAALPDVARRFRATPFMVLLAAYVALIHRRSERDDVVVGVPVGGRDRPELLPLIGMFVNMVVLRTDASGDPAFAELVERVRDVALAAWDHQEMPYQKLVEKHAGDREPGVPPLYQLGFNLLTTPGFSTTSATAEDDLLLEVAGGQVRLEHSTSLFDGATARGILDDYVRVLSAAVADTETRLSGLPVSAGSGGLAPAAGPRAAAGPVEYVPPRTSAEELVAEVWAEVLGAERVGALDDFFDLGGHSLLALRVIGRLSAACGVELSIQAFFSDTTVQGVAAELERLLAAELDEISEDDAQRLVEEG
jgi:non-ribosomal peptide synthetase component F